MLEGHGDAIERLTLLTICCIKGDAPVDVSIRFVARERGKYWEKPVFTRLHSPRGSREEMTQTRETIIPPSHHDLSTIDLGDDESNYFWELRETPL